MAEPQQIRRFRRRRGQSRPPPGVTVGLVVRLRHGARTPAWTFSGSLPGRRKFPPPLPFLETQGHPRASRSEPAHPGPMGELIDLAARREARRLRDDPRPERTRAQFFFDLSCPFSYLAAERIERAFD